MKRRLTSLPMLAGLLLLAACTGGSDGGLTVGGSAAVRGALEYGGAEPVASCGRKENLGGGRFYRVQVPSRVDGAAIVFTLFEPDRIDCAGKHPMILEGHGFGNSRKTDKSAELSPASHIDAPIASLTAAGYAVISIDQRGHGESGGTVRVMDPDYEGQDLVAIVDWAEQHLDYLAYRDHNLLLGSIGGSYGGSFQLMLYAVDPDHRLDAMVPEITWHDLSYTLNPGNVPKSYWALVLAGLGDEGTGLSMDPYIRATLLEGIANNRFPAAARPFLNYHSLSYFCGNPYGIRVNDKADTSGYALDPVISLLPITADGQYVVKTPPLARMPRVDALIFQSFRDDLFNFNEAWRNYQCLQRGGGDVRLLSYEFGHHLLSPGLGLAQEIAGGQGLPLDRKCGPIDANAATLAWFDEKLRGVGNADRIITSGRNACLSLTLNDAIQLPRVTVGGTEFRVELPGGMPVAVPIGPAGAAPVIVPLTTIGEGVNAIAGIPTATLTTSRGDPALDAMCGDAAASPLPLGSCDAEVFVGVGAIRAPLVVPELLEEQVMPVRGLGPHEVELAGVAERLKPGDQLVLMLYGFRNGYVATFSRDVSAPVVTATGTVRLPLVHGEPVRAPESNDSNSSTLPL